MQPNPYFDPNTVWPRYGSGLSNIIFTELERCSEQTGGRLDETMLVNALIEANLGTDLTSFRDSGDGTAVRARAKRGVAQGYLLAPICIMKLKPVQLIAQQQRHQSRSHDLLSLNGKENSQLLGNYFLDD